MKRLLRISFVISLISLCVFPSLNAQCDESAGAFLNGNAVRAPFYSDGYLFHDGDSNAGFIPNYQGNTSDVASLFSGALWVAGFDTNDNIKLAAGQYGWSAGEADFFSGPLNPETGNAWYADACNIFRQVWRVQRYEIENLIADFEDNNQVDGNIAHSIKSWPGKGNPFFEEISGESLPDLELAPFFDRNENGIYEPTNGEYPIIGTDFQDVIPEELLWMIFHDQGIHAETNGDPLGIEVQLTAWAFECSDTEVLSESIFTRYKITNYSSTDLKDMRIGLWLDHDLGCYEDDYLGCNPDLSTTYFYNVDALDGNYEGQCVGGVVSFEDTPPVQAVSFLNQELTSVTTINNYFGTPPSSITVPTVPMEYYNYLNGKWRDGTPVTVGDFGYNPNSEEVTNFMFPNNPNDASGWSAVTARVDPGLDMRSLSAISKETLGIGEAITIDLVYSLHHSASSDHLEGVNKMEAQIPVLQDFYNNGFENNCTRIISCTGEDCVWPGDADNDGIANYRDLLAIGVGIGKQQTGNNRISLNTSWRPNTTMDWETTLVNGVDYKHVDCNGDGEVTMDDWAVLKNNYNKQKPNEIYELEPPSAIGDIALSFESSKPEISFNMDSKLVPIQIHLDTKNSELYGLAFRVNFPPDVVDKEPFSLVQFSNQSFLNIDNEKLLLTHLDLAAGTAEFAFCRTDLTNTNGVGRIGNLLFSLEQDLATPNEDGTLNIPFTISDVRAINAEEEILEVEVAPFNMLVTEVPFDSTLVAVKELVYQDKDLQISPNPSTGTIQIVSDITIKTLHILDARGALKAVRTDISKQNTMKLPELPAGLYFLRFIDVEGRQITKRLILNEE